MYKKFKVLGQLGSHLFNTGKNYFKSGGKKTKTIMTESNVTVKKLQKRISRTMIKRQGFSKRW